MPTNDMTPDELNAAAARALDPNNRRNVELGPVGVELSYNLDGSIQVYVDGPTRTTIVFNGQRCTTT